MEITSSSFASVNADLKVANEKWETSYSLNLLGLIIFQPVTNWIIEAIDTFSHLFA